MKINKIVVVIATEENDIFAVNLQLCKIPRRQIIVSYLCMFMSSWLQKEMINWLNTSSGEIRYYATWRGLIWYSKQLVLCKISWLRGWFDGITKYIHSSTILLDSVWINWSTIAWVDDASQNKIMDYIYCYKWNCFTCSYKQP